MISIRNKNSFSKTYKYLENTLNAFKSGKMDKYGKMGVDALREATPKDTGKTSESWDYRIINRNGSISIEWFNTNIVDNVNIAVIIQYGHGTKNGGYVKGIDYINPAMKPVFKKISEELWEEIKA